MINKEVYHGQEAKTRIANGIKTIETAVGSTMGPYGDTVMIQKGSGLPIVTKDGVTVAKHLQVVEPIANMAIQVIKQASIKTAEDAGDGTTTSTVIACNAYRSIKSYLDSHPHIKIRDVFKEIRGTLKALSKSISDNSKPCTTEEELYNVALISSNADNKLSEIVAKAVMATDVSGTVLIEQSDNEDSVAFSNGFILDKGYISNRLCTDKVKLVYDEIDVTVVLLLEELSLDSILNTLNSIDLSKPVVVVTKPIEASLINPLIKAVNKPQTKIMFIETPGFGSRQDEYLQDLAVYSNASETDDPNVMIGMVDRVLIDEDSSLFVANSRSNQEALDMHIETLKVLLDRAKSSFDIRKIKERINKLVNGIATIYITALTDAEFEERKDRADDAIRSCQSALEMGITISTASALIKALDITFMSSDMREIFTDICLSPIRTICRDNTDMDTIIDAIRKSDPDTGYNIVNDEIEDLYNTGIIDPVKVLIKALDNGISVAITLISTNVVIVDDHSVDYMR